MKDWSRKLRTWVVQNKKPMKPLWIDEKNGKVYIAFISENSDGSTFSLAESFDGFNFKADEHKGTMIDLSGQKIQLRDIEKIITYSYDGKTFAVCQKPEGKIYFQENSPLLWNELAQNPVDEHPTLKAILGHFAKWSKGEETHVDYRLEYIVRNDNGIEVYFSEYAYGSYSVYVALLEKDNPFHLLWRSHDPLWVMPEEWRDKKAHIIGAARADNRVIGYWSLPGEGIHAVIYVLHEQDFRLRSRKLTVKLSRAEINPIIEPHPGHDWEAFNTFNPAAIYEGGRVHIVYRAQGYDYVSVLGYASSKDGFTINERLNEPMYVPSNRFDSLSPDEPINYSFMSGGGYAGCEDPRLTRIDDRIYMTYVAFDGATPPRVALTSILADDFLSKRWIWEKAVLISPPGVVNKNAVIFPEKINGKYVILHRVYPNILIDFVDSLDFDGARWITGQYKIEPRINMWDSKKIGAGAPPIKTKDGWLLIYQSVGYQDAGKYKIGAMLLDLKDPTRILHRSKFPILEPHADYENYGFKGGVVYPCGAVVIDGTLFVYYGAADSYVCVATADLDRFLFELKSMEIAHLDEAYIRKVL